MVADRNKVWIGLEYFCNEGDSLWNMTDEELSSLAASEVSLIGLADKDNVLDTHIVRVKKAYPAYFGGYERFPEVRAYLDSLVNLFPIGRNGMHRYNNQDHSMLTAKESVAVIASWGTDKGGAWAVNIDDDYHEEKTVPEREVKKG